MDLEALGNVGEFLGAVGVIASLVYVGYQVSETRKVVKTQTAQARTDLGVQLLLAGAERSALMHKARIGDDLTELERLEVGNYYTAYMRHVENLFFQHKQGFLDEYHAGQLEGMVTLFPRTGGNSFAEWLEQTNEMNADPSQRLFNPEFLEYVNSKGKGI